MDFTQTCTFSTLRVFFSTSSLSRRLKKSCQYFDKSLLMDAEVFQMLRQCPSLMSGQMYRW